MSQSQLRQDLIVLIARSGMSNEQVAKELRVSQRTIQYYIQGHAAHPIPYVVVLAMRWICETSLKPDSACGECGGSGSCDSGGVTPWGAAVDVRCDCTFRKV